MMKIMGMKRKIKRVVTQPTEMMKRWRAKRVMKMMEKQPRSNEGRSRSITRYLRR